MGDEGYIATFIVTEQPWKDRTIEVLVPEGEFTCDDGRHHLVVVHHHDEAGGHQCPTGFLMCEECQGIAEEPPPYTCTRNDRGDITGD